MAGLCQSRPLKQQLRAGFAEPQGHGPLRTDSLGNGREYAEFAARGGSIRMTLSLAFISPVLAEAAMGGRLPRGFCVKRLTDLPMLWSEQWRALGLQAPIQLQAHRS